jgi:hypothetical protein
VSRDPDWTRTGTVEGYAEWVRAKSDAICVVVIRRDDAVLAADPRCSPSDAHQLIAERIPELASNLAIARSEKRKAARVALEPVKE